MYTYYEKYFVGTKSEGEIPLAFLTQYGEDAAFRKRQESVDKWLQYPRNLDIKTFVIKNEPTKGFKFGDSVRRYSTQNKLIRVEDPRGWEFEISMENLAYILSECIVHKGLVIDELVYAKNSSGSICLSLMKHAEKPPAKLPKVSIHSLKPLDVFKFAKHTYVYIGDCDFHILLHEDGTYLSSHKHVGISSDPPKKIKLAFSCTINKDGESVNNHHVNNALAFKKVTPLGKLSLDTTPEKEIEKYGNYERNASYKTQKFKQFMQMEDGEYVYGILDEFVNEAKKLYGW